MAFQPIISGRVWKFGDNVSTTDITPGEMFMNTLNTTMVPKEIAFAALRPEWRSLVKPGDCIVAGKNFGYGSHRAIANDVMKDLELGCIVADSIARIYYRNSIASGFVAMDCPGVSEMFEEGDRIEVNTLTGEIKNLTTGKSIKANAYPQELMDILENGGMVPAILARFAEEKEA